MEGQIEAPASLGALIVSSFWDLTKLSGDALNAREVVLDYPCAWMDLIAARSQLGGVEPIFADKPHLCAFPRCERELTEYAHAWVSRWGGIPKHELDFWSAGPFELLPLFENATSQKLLDASQGSSLRLLPSADRLRLSKESTAMISAIYEQCRKREGKLPYFACSLEYAAAYVSGLPSDAILVVVFPEYVDDPALLWFLEDHARDRGAEIALVEDLGGRYVLRGLI